MGRKTQTVVSVEANTGPEIWRAPLSAAFAAGHAHKPHSVYILNGYYAVVNQHAYAQRKAGKRQYVKVDAYKVHKHYSKHKAYGDADGNYEG